ncbi:MAG: hypothetical protein KGY41_05425 [Desulfovermiculus sp.]|nr:hypothetical protein [Desulfovermiculus sp.]
MNDFLHDLRDVVDTDSPMLERMRLSAPKTDMGSRLQTVVGEGIQNLQHFYKQVDISVLVKVVDFIENSQDIFVIGSRLSYMPAYFMGWVLTKYQERLEQIYLENGTFFNLRSNM